MATLRKPWDEKAIRQLPTSVLLIRLRALCHELTASRSRERWRQRHYDRLTASLNNKSGYRQTSSLCHEMIVLSLIAGHDSHIAMVRIGYESYDLESLRRAIELFVEVEVLIENCKFSELGWPSTSKLYEWYVYLSEINDRLNDDPPFGDVLAQRLWMLTKGGFYPQGRPVNEPYRRIRRKE
jgi:hypothetical protein